MEIQKKLQVSVNKTEILMQECPWEEKEFYGWWLSQTFHFVSYTSRFLSLAAGCAKLTEDDLHSFFIKHIPEEAGHEKICLTDLKTLNLKVFDESESTKAFRLFQQEKILSDGVANHLGYMLFLENLSITVGTKLLKILQMHYPKLGLKFLKLHTEEDIEHVQKAIKFAEQLSSEKKIIVSRSMSESCDGYNQILTEGILRFKKQDAFKKVA